MAQAYTFDAQGNPTAQPGAGQVDVTSGGQNSMGGLAPVPQTADPYTIFNSNLMTLLTNAQKQNQNNLATLGGAKDALVNQSVAPYGPRPFDPTIGSDSQVSGMKGATAAFQPAITSINTQLENTNKNYENLSDFITKEQAVTQPLVLQPGQSLVSRDGTVIKAGHSYTPQINPLTGLMDGFDENTGSWASHDTSTLPIAPPPTSNSDLVGGVDFSGAATSTKPYATDPNYASEVDALYSQIQKSSPVPTPQTLDQFIQSHVGGKSPVTGQMIISAATQYGVDPNILAATLGHESDFGTSGAAVKTMNAGNVGNTGTSTQAFNSWQQGVNAAASELARRMPGNKNAGPSPASNTATSPVGGNFSPEATQKLSQLPPAMQKFADAGPLGIAYINSDKVPSELTQSVQTLSAKAGIPFVTSADVSGIKSIESVLGNLDLMQTLANQTLGSGTPGRAFGLTLGPLNEYAQTDWGRKLGLFDNYRDTAIKAVSALAGGAGSGLRINGAEIAANTENLPKATDNIENATADILQLKQMIYINLANTFPYAQVKVQSPTGTTGNMPVGNLALAIKAGYTVQ